MDSARKRKSEQVRRTKSPIQTVYLDKDLPHSKLPHILKINGKEEISKNTRIPAHIQKNLSISALLEANESPSAKQES